MRPIAVLLLTVVISQAQTVRFPIKVLEAAKPIDLTADALYVVEADTPHVLIASPQGTVTVTEEAGPIRIRAKFADGAGKVETRTFKGKQVWIVEPAKSGTVELLAIPTGLKAESEIVRRTVTVQAGQGPQPPPEPKPEPQPKATAAHITFVGAEQGPTSLATNNDAGLRAWLAERGVKVHVHRVGDPLTKSTGIEPTVKKYGGSPVFVLQDAGGNILTSGVLSTVGGLQAMIGPYVRAK